MKYKAVEVFVNYTPFPTFKLVCELGGALASSKNIQKPAPFNNYGILEGLEGEILILEDGIFVLKKFRNLGDFEFEVLLEEVTGLPANDNS